MTSSDEMLRSAVECLRSAEKTQDPAQFDLLVACARAKIAAASAIQRGLVNSLNPVVFETGNQAIPPGR